MKRGLVDLYVHERERGELVRLGLLPGSRKSCREEQDDLAREIIDTPLHRWTQREHVLVTWMRLPRWKQRLWTAIR